MIRVPHPWAPLLLSVLLAACATPSPAAREAHNAWQAHECEAPEEDGCVTFLCDEEACGLYRCEEVAPGTVVYARSGAAAARPLPNAHTSQRHWGGSQKLPGESQPVFIIPWHPRPPLPRQQTRLQKLARELEKNPKEKHHLFPQEQGLKEWFEAQGLNIHQDTLVLEVDTHRRIHRGARGGPWNAAWRKFKESHPGAAKEEMYRYAWELVVRFDLLGPLLPYNVLLNLPDQEVP